jgi:protein-tyrosine-phosphatase
MPIRVLFVCAANAARSQMAESLLRSLGGGDSTTRVLGAVYVDVSRSGAASSCS